MKDFTGKHEKSQNINCLRWVICRIYDIRIVVADVAMFCALAISTPRSHKSACRGICRIFILSTNVCGGGDVCIKYIVRYRPTVVWLHVGQINRNHKNYTVRPHCVYSKYGRTDKLPTKIRIIF